MFPCEYFWNFENLLKSDPKDLTNISRDCSESKTRNSVDMGFSILKFKSTNKTNLASIPILIDWPNSRAESPCSEGDPLVVILLRLEIDREWTDLNREIWVGPLMFFSAFCPTFVATALFIFGMPFKNSRT